MGGHPKVGCSRDPPKLTQVPRSLGVDAQVLHSSLQPGGVLGGVPQTGSVMEGRIKGTVWGGNLGRGVSP